MVLQYVEKHGRITRREAAEPCRLSSLQARDLLARLAKAGRLVRHGTKRGAVYELASQNMNESKPNMDKSITKSKPSNPERDA
jgi:ATP-dependent DNA helicase RecG